MTKKIKYLFNNMDKTLLGMTIFLFFFGLINIVTASSREAVVVNKAGIYYYFFRQMVILTVGSVGAFLAIKIPTKKYYRLYKWIFILSLLLVSYCFFVGETRGAQNWIPLGFFQLQPSEVAKVAIIISLSILFEKYGKRLCDEKNSKGRWIIIGFLIVIGFLIPGLVFLQKDLGTAMITCCIVGVMFLGSPIIHQDKAKVLRILVFTVVAACLGLYLSKGYILTKAQLSRFDFFNPCSKYENGGYQVCNAYIAFNDGGLFGLGIGKSKQKYSYIPEPHTDSIFAIIGEEWGVLKSSFFVFLPLLIILYRIMKISSKASTPRGRYICLGVGVYLFMHIFINLGGIFGIIPLTGVPLPFLSYGGSYTICLMIALGLVQRVNIETKTQKIKLQD